MKHAIRVELHRADRHAADHGLEPGRLRVDVDAADLTARGAERTRRVEQAVRPEVEAVELVGPGSVAFALHDEPRLRHERGVQLVEVVAEERQRDEQSSIVREGDGVDALSHELLIDTAVRAQAVDVATR